MTESPDLNVSTTHKDVIEWRLHWLWCKLENMHTSVLGTLSGNPSRMKALDVAVKVQQVQDQYERIIWEHKTMLNLDYDDEIRPFVHSLPKYKLYFESLTRMKELVCSMAEGEGRQILHESLNAMKGSFHEGTTR